MTPSPDDRVARLIDAALAARPDGVLEQVAADCEASLFDVLKRLPEGAAVIAEGERFEEVWGALTEWGDVPLILHTKDVVIECTAPLPPGSSAHGYFNVHGSSPIGGHIKATNCRAIAFVDRDFHGRQSCSVQFLNGEGTAMFKVFVRRDEERTLIGEQLDRFVSLRARFGEPKGRDRS